VRAMNRRIDRWDIEQLLVQLLTGSPVNGHRRAREAQSILVEFEASNIRKFHAGGPRVMIRRFVLLVLLAMLSSTFAAAADDAGGFFDSSLGDFKGSWRRQRKAASVRAVDVRGGGLPILPQDEGTGSEPSRCQNYFRRTSRFFPSMSSAASS